MTTEERVKEILVESLGVEPSEITLDANIRDDLDADSLDMVEIIMNAEKEFGIDVVADEIVENIVTVRDIVSLVDHILNGGISNWQPDNSDNITMGRFE